MPLDDVAHVVQLALTPVFLLSGVGTLLNVFNTRLARVRDQAERANELLAKTSDQAAAALVVLHLRRLRHRTAALDASVISAALAGTATCGAATTLFLGALKEAGVATVLYVLFGTALAFLMVALVMFMLDSMLAWHGIRTHGPAPRSQVGLKAASQRVSRRRTRAQRHAQPGPEAR